jgi:hypothetical protein
MNVYRAQKNSQKIRNASNRIRNNGNKNASKEINHHLSGCRNALQQARRNKHPVIILSRREKRLVNFRSEVMRMY